MSSDAACFTSSASWIDPLLLLLSFAADRRRGEVFLAASSFGKPHRLPKLQQQRYASAHGHSDRHGHKQLLVGR